MKLIIKVLTIILPIIYSTIYLYTVGNTYIINREYTPEFINDYSEHFYVKQISDISYRCNINGLCNIVYNMSEDYTINDIIEIENGYEVFLTNKKDGKTVYRLHWTKDNLLTELCTHRSQHIYSSYIYK